MLLSNIIACWFGLMDENLYQALLRPHLPMDNLYVPLTLNRHANYV